MLNEKGILLLALCHPYYGRMAYNLAMSIKSVDPSVHITLVYSGAGISHINQRNMWVFDNKMQIEDDGKPFGTKLRLKEFSPYERTLYIDADTVWVGKVTPSILMDQLKGIAFTGITEGFHDFNEPEKSQPSKNYFFWADVEEVKERWALTERLYQWRSEFIYFEKCDKTDVMFNLAQSVYANPKLNKIKMFAGHIPDELAINIATCVYNMPPHEYKWKPSYWDALHGGNMPHIDELGSRYYVVSCGGNANFGALKRMYDGTVGASAYRLKLQHVFPLISKREMLTSRQLM